LGFTVVKFIPALQKLGSQLEFDLVFDIKEFLA